MNQECSVQKTSGDFFFLKKLCRSFYFMNTWKQTFRWKRQKVFQENIFFSCVKPGQINFMRKTQNNISLQNFSRVKPSGKKKLSGEFYFQSACKMSWTWSIKWNKQKHSSTSELYFHSIWISAATRLPGLFLFMPHTHFISSSPHVFISKEEFQNEPFCWKRSWMERRPPSLWNRSCVSLTASSCRQH